MKSGNQISTGRSSSLVQTFGRTRIGKALRFALHPQRSLQRKRSIVALASEVMKLGIVKSNPDGDWPAITLADGTCFHGRPPAELDRSVYQQLSRECRLVLPECCVGVAVDVVCRYMYPHAVAAITPPIPLLDRSVLHRQHRDTIGDVPDSEMRIKQELLKHFSIGDGDVVLDVGGYIGMGAMRLSRLVGSAGRVVSVETQPLNQEILLRNLESNDINNVSLIRGAVWETTGQMELQCDTRQKNSLVDQIVSNETTIQVDTYTIDDIVAAEALPRLTHVSLTINGAEPEAIDSMTATLDRFSPSIHGAGWYLRGQESIGQMVQEKLKRFGYRVYIGREGRFYGWKGE